MTTAKATRKKIAIGEHAKNKGTIDVETSSLFLKTDEK
jgi:hypothetical protein